MKSYTPSANDYIEMAFRFAGVDQNYNRVGLLMADGTTFGSGSQVMWFHSFSQSLVAISPYTGYNTDIGGATTKAMKYSTAGTGTFFIRLKYEGSNHWRGYISADGISWADLTGQITLTLSPTKIGFFVTTYGATSPFVASLYYFKQSA